MYTPHPSRELYELFVRKPYQGAAPEQARYLFVGLDANYDPSIEHSPIFPRLREYHTDGAAFWHRYGVHHPFLLPDYSGDGRFYHQSFARIGFGAQHANLVSFVELLHVPTAGRSKLDTEDLSSSHLAFLNSVILDGNARHVFVPAGVARLMRDSRAFPWLLRFVSNESGPLGTLYRSAMKSVYSHLHFSVYGKFHQRKADEAAAIRALLSRDG